MTNPVTEYSDAFGEQVMIGHTPDASTATDVDVFLATDQDW